MVIRKDIADVSGCLNGWAKYDKDPSSVTKKSTPSTNNYTSIKRKSRVVLKQHDKFGASMTITAMLVVFSALVLLYIVFRFVKDVYKSV